MTNVGASADPNRVVAAARSWLGTPYHDQASLRGVGCDCLGLVRGVWREVVGPEPVPIPPYRRDHASRELARRLQRVMTPRAPLDAGPGALVVFAMGGGAAHLGLWADTGTFVHAHARLGVLEDPLTRTWQRRMAWAFLFPGGR